MKSHAEVRGSLATSLNSDTTIIEKIDVHERENIIQMMYFQTTDKFLMTGCVTSTRHTTL